MKKILILSDEKDLSTDDVIDWIVYYQYSFVRINDSSDVEFNYYVLNKKTDKWLIKVDDKRLYSQDIHSYWYRRGEIIIDFDKYQNYHTLNERINRYLTKEINGIHISINNHLNHKKPRIGNFYDNYINKLDVLKKALSFGLNIPDTLITTSKQKVQEFIKKHKRLITKAINQGISLKYDNKQIEGYTNLLTLNEVDKLDDLFFPTLFQELLNKKWEIRTFYLKGKCYSSAIFSQKDEKTKVDFRHYGTKYMNRVASYKLPDEVENKIINLMNDLNMSSGSIDLVYTLDSKYVFLEINPVGQFAQVSDPCNYCLEEKIAKHLINE